MFRIYIDEVGNHDLGSSRHPNERYLAVTGVIMDLGYANATAYPRVEALKDKYFGMSAADEPVILHRKEIAQQKAPFDVLKDDAIRGHLMRTCSACCRSSSTRC